MEMAIAVKDWDDAKISLMKKLKRYVATMQSFLPLDSQNRVTALINPRVLLSTGLTVPVETFVDSPPTDVTLPISYLEGIPTIYGIPLWERLEGEATEYYELFKRYRALKAVKGARSVHFLSLETSVSPMILEQLRQIYAWQVRSAAFDMYMDESEAELLKQRRKVIEGEHSKKAEKIFDLCTDYMIDNIQMLTPKAALEWAEMAYKLQRISVGLSPDKPGAIDGNTGIQVNIQNGASSVDTNNKDSVGITGNKDDDASKLKQLLNIMSTVGVFNENKVIIDAEIVEEEEE